MNQIALRALQTLASFAALGVAGVLVWQFRGDTSTEAYLLGLIALIVVQLGFIAFAGSKTPKSEKPEKDPVRSALEGEVDGILDGVVSSLNRHISLNHDYQTNLTGLNQGLQQLPSRTEVQDIIIKLMNKNMDMQAKVTDLSRELEASQQQIVSLRNNVTEVGKIALIDSLTELGNRRFFDQALQTEITKARKEGRGLCLAMADLDRFKSVNDRFGHVVGDHLLRLFADLVASNIRGKAIAARYGGEEFALLFPDATIEAAAGIVDKIRRDLEAKQWVVGAKKDKLGTITASFGVARFAGDESPEAFVRRADAKLFEAKSAGRNRVVSETTKEAAPIRSGTRDAALAS